jgi:hypothetical protein
MEVSMKRQLISAFAVIAMLAAASTLLQSHSSATKFSAGPAGMMPVQVLLGAAGSTQLPIEEFEDQSLVFSNAPKR